MTRKNESKEYIVANEATLKYPAEIRLQACLLQKELYEKNNAMQTAEPEEFQMREGEISVEIAAAVRVFLDDSSYESQVAKDLTSRFICEIISRTAAEDKRFTRIEEELNPTLPKKLRWTEPMKPPPTKRKAATKSAQPSSTNS